MGVGWVTGPAASNAGLFQHGDRSLDRRRRLIEGIEVPARHQLGTQRRFEDIPGRNLGRIDQQLEPDLVLSRHRQNQEQPGPGGRTRFHSKSNRQFSR